MRLLLITVVLFGASAIAAGGVLGNSSTLQALQDQLDRLGKTMLETSRQLQSSFGRTVQRLNEQLVRILMEAYQELDKIHRNTGEFIEGYNMTDKYCMEIVGYLYWARAEEAVAGMQDCAGNALGKIDGVSREEVLGLLEQARLSASEVQLIVVRKLTESSDLQQIETSVTDELEQHQLKWVQKEEKLTKAVYSFRNSQKAITDRTEKCTKEVIDQYSIHMGYIQYYLNKNKNCQR